MMAGGDEGTKRAWIRRILGVELSGADGNVSLADSVAGWQRALKMVDDQIAALQKVLRATPDPELQDIAEFGLGAMTGSHKVKIQAALLDMQSGTGGGRKAVVAIRLVDAFLAHLASDPRIAACDASPFGVPMSIRRTLTPALDALRSALRAAG
jgi:hypothetical protein